MLQTMHCARDPPVRYLVKMPHAAHAARPFRLRLFGVARAWMMLCWSRTHGTRGRTKPCTAAVLLHAASRVLLHAASRVLLHAASRS